MTQSLAVNLPMQPAKCYPIHIGLKLHDVGAWLPTHRYEHVVIITDTTVGKHYGYALKETVAAQGINTLLLSFPAGERSKTQNIKNRIENEMLEKQCGRNTLLIALGGGVVGDLSGFIAATYCRGIPYIQIPTTLLAMVDSSVGGKTAINTPYGKNLIGAIYQPTSVIMDTTLLNSLPKKHMINGMIEAIKMFLTHDATSFDFTCCNLSNLIGADEEMLKALISRAIRIKAGIVMRDERERGERSVLNFGHTIGHALEKIAQYKLLHGYAVGYGILVEATLSHQLGLLDKKELCLITEVFSRLGICGKDLKKYASDELIQATRHDKKIKFGQVNYVLLQQIGVTYQKNDNYIHPIDDNMVLAAINKTIEETYVR